MDHAKAMQLARELSSPLYAPGPIASELERVTYERLIRRIAAMVLPVGMQQEFLAHFPFYGSEPDDVLCNDEGCPQHGKTHVCRDGTGFYPATDHTGHEL